MGPDEAAEIPPEELITRLTLELERFQAGPANDTAVLAFRPVPVNPEGGAGIRRRTPHGLAPRRSERRG